MVCSYICCGTCCGIFSVVCTLFLGGLASNVKGSGTRLYLADDEFDEAYDAILQAIYGYLTCIFLSAGMYVYGIKKKDSYRSGTSLQASLEMQQFNSERELTGDDFPDFPDF